jgi:hypothetical protein
VNSVYGIADVARAPDAINSIIYKILCCSNDKIT